MRSTRASRSRGSLHTSGVTAGSAWSGIVGVQSNQFPRALDIARPFRAAGVPVMIGGFHVSGLPRHAAGMQAGPQGAPRHGREPVRRRRSKAGWTCSCRTPPTAGCSRSTISSMTCRRLRPSRRPSFRRAAATDAPDRRPSTRAAAAPSSARSAPSSTCRAGKSRRRSAEDVERTIREHWAEGLRDFLITDDNMARNKDWEPIFDRLIAMREREG